MPIVVTGTQVYRPPAATTVPSTNMLMRFRADDISGANGASVTSWSESSGNSLPAAVGTNTTLATNSGGTGHKGVVFNGSSAYMTLSGSALDVARNKAAITVFAAVAFTTTVTTGTRTLFSLSTGTGATSSRVLLGHRDSVSGLPIAGGRRLDSNSLASTTGTVINTVQNTVLTARYVWSSSDVYLYQDGTETGSNTSFQTDGSTDNTASLAGVIGANLAGNNEWFQGHLLELLVYNDADTSGTLRQSVHTYFQSTYGITSSDATSAEYPTSMPVGDLPGWTQVVAEDFDTDVAEGGFVANVNGNLTSAGLAGYNAYGAGAPGGAKLTMYPKVWASTGTRTTSGTGIWDEGIVSVQSSILRMRMRTITDAVGTFPRGCAVKPVLPGGSYDFGPYGKYAIRVRTTEINGSPTNYHTLMLAIKSTNWDGGELDWMECDADGTLNGWYHYATPQYTRIDINGNSTGNDPKIRATSPKLMSNWNIVDVEWTPTLMKWTVWTEGEPSAYTALSSTTGVPTIPMAVLLQMEPAVGTTPAPSNTATCEVDWFVMYEYAP